LSDITAPETPSLTNRTKKNYPPGYVIFGRGQGCDFVLDYRIWTKGSTTEWPERARYVCDPAKNKYGCTPDNRGTAVCQSKTYKSDLSEDFSCVFDSNPANCKQNNKAPKELPEIFRHFGDAITGGLNEAMDYVPFNYMLRNCADNQNALARQEQLCSTCNSTSNATAGGQNEGSIKDAFDFFTGSAETVGGQVYCKDCRCMMGSLVALGSLGVLGNFESNGRCYKTNCFTENYLQVGIVSATAVKWYKCPENGGAIFIAGFSGQLICPAANTFCRYENITGQVCVGVCCHV